MLAKNTRSLLGTTFKASSQRFCCPRSGIEDSQHRSFHLSALRPATPLPIGVVGPLPSPPLPAAPQHDDRFERRRKQAEMLRQGKEIRASQSQKGKSSPLKKRFWKDVDVKETPDGYQIFLDSRPVRTPNKTTLTIPLSKPHLAHAIALEWDLLTSAQQALKNHNIPLTSLASRADDILTHDILHQQQSKTPSTPSSTSPHHRPSILQTLLGYLDTDTLLCWAPEKPPTDDLTPPPSATSQSHLQTRTSSLRATQKRLATPILSYLTNRVWPGISLHPILDSTSILPKKQPEMTRNVIGGWMAGLSAYELAALERGVLASKSLLVATRLVVEWSEEWRDVQGKSGWEGEGGQERRFGIEEAAEACTTEVRWQTDLWGEVEDTHDVEREDLKRQLGSVVLLVSGNKA